MGNQPQFQILCPEFDKTRNLLEIFEKIVEFSRVLEITLKNLNFVQTLLVPTFLPVQTSVSD